MEFLGINVALFIATAGYAGVFAVMFLQIGFVFGIILPGTSFLLFTGFLAAEGYFSITGLIISAILGAFIGSTLGWATGRKMGSTFFRKNKKEWIFNRHHISRLKTFYRKHGGITIVFAYFLHFARTFVPVLAGMGKMSYIKFLFYSIIGAVVWAGGVPFLGYRFGVAIPGQYMKIVLIILVVIIVISAISKIIKRINKSVLSKHALCMHIEEVNRNDTNIAGGKGANLGELTQAGFSVPGGFIVTTLAYDKFVEENSLQEAIDIGLEDASNGGKYIRDAFIKGNIPEDVKKEIIAYYRTLGEHVAIRSSATAEDTLEATFAGQQDTFLNVYGEHEVLESIKMAWASLWTDRAIAYRKKQKTKTDNLKLAVVIQRMADAKSAGVMFTVNPVTGDEKELIINSSTGLGESVVSGLVTPDHFVLKKRFGIWRITEKTLGEHEVTIKTPNSDELFDANKDKEIDKYTNEEFSIPEETAIELAKLGYKIDMLFGVPQDIEWAWSGKDIKIVQTRPMTALPPKESLLTKIRKKPAGIFAEVFSIRPYPLDVTIWWREVFKFLNMVAGLVGARFRKPDKLFTEKNGVLVSFNGKMPIIPTPLIILTPFKLLYLYLRYDPIKWMDKEKVNAIIERVHSIENKDMSSASWEELLGWANEAVTVTTRYFIMEIRYRYLPPAAISTGLLYIQLSILGKRKLFSALLSGIQTKTMEANAELIEIGKMVAGDNYLLSLFNKYENKALIEKLQSDKKASHLQARIDKVMDAYGHREAHFTGPSQPSWKDNPEAVISMIRNFTSYDKKVEDNKHPKWKEAKNEVLAHRALSNQFLKRRFIITLLRARCLWLIREDTHFYGTLSLPALRRIFLECGHRLHEVGALSTAKDIFNLKLEELEELKNTWPPTKSKIKETKKTAEQRKEKRESLEGVPLIDSKYFSNKHKTSENVLLRGTPGSPGVVKGKVKIIMGMSDFGRLENGDVLVAPHTNPSWTPLFQQASAVVVDTGGVASHAAIVAREYGIPAVMATAEGTKKLIDGQEVTVNGNTGTVE